MSTPVHSRSRPGVEIIDSDEEILADEQEAILVDDDSWDEGTSDISDDDDEEDSDLDLLTLDGGAQERVQNRPVIASQRRALQSGYEIVPHHGIFGELDLTAGVNVTLVDGDFFRIKHVLRNRHTQQETMHGWRLRRTCYVENRLSKTAGELCMVVTASSDDKRGDWERGLEELSMDNIDFDAYKCIRDIIFTNQEAPALRDNARFNRDIRKHVREGILVCRVKHVILYAPNSKAEMKPVEQIIESFRKEDADAGYGIWDESKILARGKACDVERVREALNLQEQAKQGIVSRANDSTPKRAWKRRRLDRLDEDVQTIDELAFQEAMRRHQQVRSTGAQNHRRKSYSAPQQYHAADICCGGGGASGGIAETPFKLVWGLDKDLGAARAWSLNWPNATTYHMNIGDFVKHEIHKCAYAHAIHFSFSCKAWSFANPYKGEFEANPDDIASTLAAPAPLRILRPRLATFENADGFQAIRKHRHYFNAFIKSIVDQGYNVRWKVIDLARYGNPQHRKRLIVIASCSGEELPEFPPPTHGPEPGLLSFRTTRNAIAGIRKYAPLHNRKQMRQKWKNRPRRNMYPAQWDEVLPHGLTTGGPRDIHPDGKREFTVRECMALMRFRAEHKLPEDLCQTKMREIVGNAVPRDLIRLIYTRFHQVLRDTDEKIERYRNVDLDGGDDDGDDGRRPPTPIAGRAHPITVPERISPATSLDVQDRDQEGLADSPFHTSIPLRPAAKKPRTLDGVSGVKGEVASKQGFVRGKGRASSKGDVVDLT